MSFRTYEKAWTVLERKRAIELVAGKESALAQVVITTFGKSYDLTFAVGDANNACESSMMVEAFAGTNTVQVPYQSKGKGGFVRGKLRFKAVSTRTRLRFLSTFYTMKSDNSGSLCGPVIDDVKLLGVRYPTLAWWWDSTPNTIKTHMLDSCSWACILQYLSIVERLFQVSYLCIYFSIKSNGSDDWEFLQLLWY